MLVALLVLVAEELIVWLLTCGLVFICALVILGVACALVMLSIVLLVVFVSRFQAAPFVLAVAVVLLSVVLAFVSTESIVSNLSCVFHGDRQLTLLNST